ncbi:MAG TPA: serine/threonine-protein kinase, partial [Myxococcales bacterium]
HPQYNSDAKIVERFYNEARAVNVIGHDNILKILDLSVTEDGLHYFVMEFLDGKSLHDLLHEGEPLPLEVAGPILLQICDALEAAHQKGIVHRDLKPDNVYLIALNARQNFVKLVDFGIARVAPQDGVSAGRTVTGMVMGTPSYMSPEQGSGATRQIDGRSDVYSLGVMMFQLATGYLPFRGDNFGEVLVAHLQVPAPPLSAICPEVPEVYEQVVLRCLAKDQSDRFQSMRELRFAIEDCLDELGIPAELPSVAVEAVPAEARAPARNSKPPAPRRKSDPPAPPPQTQPPAVRRISKPPERKSDPQVARVLPQRKSNPPAPLEARTKVEAARPGVDELHAEQPGLRIAEKTTQIEASRRRPFVFAAGAGALAAAALIAFVFARGGHARAAPPGLASVAPATPDIHEEVTRDAAPPPAAQPAPQTATDSANEPRQERPSTDDPQTPSHEAQTPPHEAQTATHEAQTREHAQRKPRHRASGIAHAAAAPSPAAKTGAAPQTPHADRALRQKDDGLIELDDAQ